MSSFIIICGNNGVGKTTLARILSEEGYGEVVRDRNDDYAYRRDFFMDKHRWSFHNQCQYLLLKFKQQKAAQTAHSLRPRYQVRGVYDCYEIFSRKLFDDGFMTLRDFRCLTELYTLLSACISAPTLIIRLKAPVELLLERIQQRGRSIDHDLSLAYLADIEKRFENWIEHIPFCPVLELDTKELDYVSNQEVRKAVIERILADANLDIRLPNDDTL